MLVQVLELRIAGHDIQFFLRVPSPVFSDSVKQFCANSDTLIVRKDNQPTNAPVLFLVGRMDKSYERDRLIA